MDTMPTRFRVHAHEWDEEMTVPAVDLMLDIRDEDQYDMPDFRWTNGDLRKLELELQVMDIPWREAFCEGIPFRCGTWDHLRRTKETNAS